jgi:hypothetical protein
MTSKPQKVINNQLKQLQKALERAFSEDELKRMVRFELGESLDSIAGGQNLSMRVFNLIEWAEARGLTEELIQGACTQNPGNIELQKFVREREVAQSSVIQDSVQEALENSRISHISSLSNLVVQITDDDKAYEQGLKEAFSHISATQWLFPGNLTRPVLFQKVFISLTDKPRDHLKNYNLDERRILFVELLARTTQQSDVQQKLRDWIDTFADSQNISPHRVRQLRAYSPPAHEPAQTKIVLKADRPSLLIKIRTHPHLLLEAYLWKDQHDIHLIDSGRTFQPDDMPTILAELLDKSLSFIPGQSHEVCFEFFLPYELYLRRDVFQHRLDNLSIAWGLEEQHLGTYYYVVLRSLDRIEGKHVYRLRDRWVEKWRKIRLLHKALLNGEPITTILSKMEHHPVVCSEIIEQEIDRLDGLLEPCDVLALALWTDAVAACGIEPKKIFAKMLQTGLPVALWIEPDEHEHCLPLHGQDGATLKKMREDLDSLVIADNLPGLPAIVKTKRQEAKPSALHIGAYLSLFWDDADRLPYLPSVDRQAG